MSSHAERRKGLRLNAEETVLLICDMQDGFSHAVYFSEVVQVVQRLIKAAKILDLKTIVTEHQPKEWGKTTSELDFSEINPTVMSKIDFSMYPAIKDHLSPAIKAVILCGVAANCCVYHTTLDLLDEGYAVHLVLNGTSTMSMVDRMYAFEQLEHVGAILTTADTAILSLIRTSAHPKYQEIKELVHESLPDTGLVPKMSQP